MQVADQYWEPLDVKTHMLILLLPLILINYVRNLKLLAPFSTLANAITFVGLAMILVYMFDDLPSPSEREMFGTLRNFSLYFGTTLFALEAVGVVSVYFPRIIFAYLYFPFSFLWRAVFSTSYRVRRKFCLDRNRTWFLVKKYVEIVGYSFLIGGFIIEEIEFKGVAATRSDGGASVVLNAERYYLQQSCNELEAPFLENYSSSGKIVLQMIDLFYDEESLSLVTRSYFRSEVP